MFGTGIQIGVGDRLSRALEAWTDLVCGVGKSSVTLRLVRSQWIHE
jgi:hypothetical protein